MLLSACTGNSSGSPVGEGSTRASIETTPGTVSPGATSPEIGAGECEPVVGTIADLPSDPVDATLQLTAAHYSCASVVVVVDTSGDALAVGAELALSLESPMLAFDEARLDAVLTEIARLEPDRVVYVEGDEGEFDIPAEWDRRVPTGPIPTPDQLFSAPAATGPVWVVAEQQATAGIAVLPTIFDLGGSVMLSTQPLVETDPTQVGVIGVDSPTERWELLAQSNAPQLPGGGITLFPGRRIVAFYGSPVTFRLGILGEQGPEATIEKLELLAAEYAIPGGAPVIPALEMIVTVADSKPGDDNDYSNELAPRDFQRWTDAANESDAYIILDLQPGRTDFLTQAKRYEDLLRLPNVGLALDPEWRLEDDQVHLQQIGTVDAEEINEVVAWLSELVREETLPQKLLVLHQFNLDMITNRQDVHTPPELAVVVHVDGQGRLFSKYGTYETILEAPIGPDQTLWWGWKNFLDEDFPTARPEQVNAVEPLPVVITYQ